MYGVTYGDTGSLDYSSYIFSDAGDGAGCRSRCRSGWHGWRGLGVVQDWEKEGSHGTEAAASNCVSVKEFNSSCYTGETTKLLYTTIMVF